MRPSPLSCAAAVALLAGLAGGPARADDFLKQEGDLWRASKLVGVNVFGPDNKKVGAINDVLMGKDGKAAYVVVGVGGVLGIGQKDVAVPFDKVKFSQEPMPQPAAPAGNANAPAGTMAPMRPSPASGDAGSTAPTGGLGTPTAANSADGAAGAPGAGMTANGAMTTPMSNQSAAYPDHGTIDYTADQLNAAPTFTYAK